MFYFIGEFNGPLDNRYSNFMARWKATTVEGKENKAREVAAVRFMFTAILINCQLND